MIHSSRARSRRMYLGIVLSIAAMLWGTGAHATRLQALDDDGKLRGPFVSLDGHVSILSDVEMATESLMVRATGQ